MKQCTVCRETKSSDEYYNYKNSKDVKQYRCKDCDALSRKGWADRNPERSRLSNRSRQLKHKYGISVDEYNILFKAQGESCAICRTKENKVTGFSTDFLNFAVDHNRHTGKIRGLLCNQCNRALGMLEDTPEMLKRVLNYLGETH